MIRLYGINLHRKVMHMGYRVRDWEKFKHFKDRNAPWVKLNKDLLNNRDWFELPAETAKALVMLWLVASEDPEREGNLPGMKELAFRLRTTESELRKHLDKLGKWLEQTDTGKEAIEPEVLHDDNEVITPKRHKRNTRDSVSSKSTKQPSRKKTYARHEYSKDFKRFWALYPNNQHKKNAARKFDEITKVVPVAEIIAGLQRQLESKLFVEDPKHFTNAETWLHQRRWEQLTPNADKDSGPA